MKLNRMLTVLSAIVLLSASASVARAEYLDACLTGTTVQVDRNPYTKSGFITKYKVQNECTDQVNFRITITYANGEIHSWDWILQGGQSYTMFLDTQYVLSATVTRK